MHVAFCGHDLVLWKYAGAEDVSSGKFFNLRRFTPSRWRDDEAGGRQVSYWNEGQLFTLLRDQDVLRLDRDRWFDGRSFNLNPYGEQILGILRAGSGTPWLKLSWQQYLRWVANADQLYSDTGKCIEMLDKADAKWGELAAKRILFVDRPNDGSNIRTWLNALHEGGGR